MAAHQINRGPQILYQHGALGAGSDFWVIPTRKYSLWNEKLDWYLNFLLSRAENHVPLSLSDEIKKIVSDYELEDRLPKTDTISEFLMIACEQQLPARILVRVPYKDNVEAWLENIHKLWVNFSKPSLRIFLPNEFPVSQFSAFWPEDLSELALTLVPSQNSSGN